ncbi:glutamate--tRNA ligase [Desertibaculum subflavum]|uniref:glutamate--tRNA ligase n=1 Tax=Desertibaculum subflavum TaxID=2268458 RepID=UPI000E6693D8
MSVVVRFAPSPTGFLHIGGGRTALFNWLFARHHGGTFRLRIEDTDRARSTEAAIDAIFDGLKWLGLDWDDEVVFQFARMARHAEVARAMLANGQAYRCYCTPEELEAKRAEAKAAGKVWRYDGIWRDRDPKDAPAGVQPVIRFKAPREGSTTIDDLVQGEVTVANQELDDLVILRADGTPTYNFSVVVDDHDMGITHVIRGDDHLTNAFRQTQLYLAAGFALPEFAHIPLIHGPDGAKLSKRHGALGVDAYRDMGYLPEAMRNYLLRLGWSHGDDEVISTEQAIEWFGLDHVGRSPSRFDFDKLAHLNGVYIRQADNARLVEMVIPRLAALAGGHLPAATPDRLLALMAPLKERAKTLQDLAQAALFLAEHRPLQPDAGAAKLLQEAGADLVGAIHDALNPVTDWTAPATEAAIRALVEAKGLKLGKVAQPLRAALTGRTVSPPIFDVLAALGRDESLGRLQDAAK